MHFRLLISYLGFLSIVVNMSNAHSADPEKIVIAHRGASGYLPEHSLAAKALAYGMGADFLEQDCVLTADDHPVVLHDIHLDTVTDVAKRFPDRARDDGRFYAFDFTLAEIKTLALNERINLDSGKRVYPNRFPAGATTQRVPTLAEEIELIQGMNKSTGRNVGIYPEIKSPAWHRKQGKDISQRMLAVLKRYGYDGPSDRVYLQCFDAAETRRVRVELKTRLPIIQLIGENDWGESTTDYDALRTKEGLAKVAEYANGIGPFWKHVITGVDANKKLKTTSLVADAHALGLAVHPYTFRADDLPDFTKDFDRFLHGAYFEANLDGLFTDFPDRAVKVLINAE